MFALIHRSVMLESNFSSGPQHTPWTAPAVISAAVVCVGTAFSSLFFQHVSNVVPKFYYSVAVISPVFGFACYSLLIMGRHFVLQEGFQMTKSIFQSALKYCTAIGLCFAMTNILVDYGRSGSSSGVPEVSTVLVLILGKLVVPVSLLLESYLEWQQPSGWQLAGVAVLMCGVASTAFSAISRILPSPGEPGQLLRVLRRGRFGC